MNGPIWFANWVATMADGIKANFDFSGWDHVLAQLGGSVRESLGRSMAVAGGQILRDEAKQRVPVKDGLLRDAIYLAFREAQSTSRQAVYAVSWNSKKAPHGHLIEFGHWQTHVTFIGKDGHWHSDPNQLLANPKWIAAQPFLRPALDGGAALARAAMLKHGRERLSELLAEVML